MTIFHKLAVIAALTLSALSPTLAETTGSHGWSRSDLTLRSGPGAAYEVTGSIEGEVAIRIVRCQVNWCVVDGQGKRGWTSRELVSFGMDPHSPLFVVAPDHPDAGPGSVCFYAGKNYSGASVCAGPGEVFSDLALYGYDNRFSSVQVIGSVNVAACRDRGFQSYCERIVKSQPVLNQLLARNLSSFHVYGGGLNRPLDGMEAMNMGSGSELE